MENCIFCKIAKGDIPCSKVYEDEKILAFKDIEPQAPIHILIIPKHHIESLNSLSEEDADIVTYIFMKAKQLAKDLGVAESGYRIVNNCGEDGGQTVKHLHFHMLAGRNLQWPPG
ncbi:histidine triad nucleotide-binding protein [Haloimpatiens lingqiaonensis]|uniref:histidine triad nucleotide-binding protein n=1 Tax=Haloimpatiens lingqiaonensis TaxID=1380675 RepID=UPI0010FD1214|nr:histidine triad nucleotide-binding protein [Haloimpatiens lingqiaonensis]